MPNAERGTFHYANPAVIHWGAGCVAERLDPELRKLGAQRVFLVTTRSVAANPELAGSVQRLLGERLVGVYSTIGQHAPASAVAEATAAAAEARPDLLLSMGGGSPIDATKIVAFSLASGLDLRSADAAERARGSRLDPQRVLPHVAIPTTLSVAELSNSAGFTDEHAHEKASMRAPELTPVAVFYDAALALHTPLPLWLSTGIRAVDHAVESMLWPGSHPYSDTLGLEGLKRLQRGLLAACSDPSDAEARTEGQLGAWFSFTFPAAAGGLSHTLGKRIGASHGIPHGVTSCLLLPHVMRYVARDTAAAQARIAEALGVDTRRLSLEQAAARAADAVAELIARLGQPTHLAEYRLSEADLAEAVAPVASREHPAEELLEIFRAAW